MMHCWTGEREHIEATYGHLSPEYLDCVCREGPGRTCMLAAGHDGPHIWTPDDEISITFCKEPDDEH